MATRFTAADVLEFLDRCLADNPLWTFVDLTHPYVYTANSRLTLFADEQRWALVGEVSGYSPRAARFSLTMTWFGNCLRALERGGDRNQFTRNTEFLTLIEQVALGVMMAKFDAGATPLIAVPVRDGTVYVPGTAAELQPLVPDILTRGYPKEPRIQDLCRYIAYAYPDACRATEAEKRLHLPADLPYLMMVDEWHHRSFDYYANGLEPRRPIGDAPSSYETYRLIADVLATRHPRRYRPTLRPNSHWTNWPAAGSL